MSSNVMIEFKNVSFRYADDEPWVLKNVNFRIKSDEWVAIIGHNGSGKSTIAKLTNGLLFPQEGEISINGMAITESTIWDIRRSVGMVFQNPDNQFVGTTVRDDVAFGLENRGMPREEMIVRIDESLSAVGMTDYIMHEPHRLSGGQKQRIAIASVLAISPSIIILDEATAMLDPRGRFDILKVINDVKVKHSLALVTITHDLNEIIQADKVIVMNQGEVWDQTTPRELFTKQDKLLDIGLDVPFIAKLANEFVELGVHLRQQPLSREEFLEELWIYHSKM